MLELIGSSRRRAHLHGRNQTIIPSIDTILRTQVALLDHASKICLSPDKSLGAKGSDHDRKNNKVGKGQSVKE